MNRIVSNGLKIDLHIHSCASSHKDGAKVLNNTVSNIPLLIQKLNEQGVNMCAITDHDTFSYEMYSELKKAEHTDNSIQKVLPGIEFSVCFEYEGEESVIHVIAIFSDDDDSRVQNIERIINENPPDYNESYKEERFLALLRKIEINTILIAHQKNTLMSTKPRKHDANTLGSTKFLEFVYSDYFEAYEFKNRRNEVFNKNFLVLHDLEDQLRFVTGTDCHDWSVYPSETPLDLIEDFPYTFAKCLPTFKGLVMAITDHSRLKTVDSFFTATKYTMPSITLTQGGKRIDVPLSKGINVIIGDNSIGKSMMLHALTGFSKPSDLLPATLKSGYKKYLKDLGISIPVQLTDDHVFCFDMQGEVRSKFEENKLNTTEFLAQYFPDAVDSTAYRALLEESISKMLSYLEKKFRYDKKLKSLNSFAIEVQNENAESIVFENNIGRNKPKSDKYSDIALQIENVITQLSILSKKDLDVEDKAFVNMTLGTYVKMKEKYNNRIKQIEAENSRMENVSKIIRKYSDRHRRSITDSHKKLSEYVENISSLKSKLIELIQLYRTIGSFSPHIDDITVRANSNQVYDYEFISRLRIETINKEYLASLVSRVLKTKKHISWDTITEKELEDMLLRYDGTPVLQFFKEKLKEQIEEDIKPKNSIINQGTDRYAEMSAGLDAKIYFDLLSYETQREGVYIIDQPEDNVSQSAIKDFLLDRFKTMGENRQIIMVSHNPQFIVNLDVDNIVFLSKKDGNLNIQSGALEYTCSEYSILDIVAQHIDGGLDSIRKRWKRYEKTTNS